MHNVTNDKLLDCLVLSNTTSTVGAANSADVSAAVLRASVVSAFACLERQKLLMMATLHCKTRSKRGTESHMILHVITKHRKLIVLFP